MLFAAKLAAPLATAPGVRQSVITRALENALSLISAPAGYFLAEGLSASLAEQRRPVLWLRLGPEDRDPAHLLLALMAGARRLCADPLGTTLGTATLEQMRRRPGPIAGWPPLFRTLARELGEALPAATVMVLEHLEHLNGLGPALELLGRHLLTILPRGITCLLTSNQRLFKAALPGHTVQIGVDALRLDERAALALMHAAHVDLPKPSLRRAVSLTNGCATPLLAVAEASESLGPSIVQRLIERAANPDDLLARIAHAWLALAGPDDWQALTLLSRLEYGHAALGQRVPGLGASTALDGPWLQRLDDGWLRVRPGWDTALDLALRTQAPLKPEVMSQAADFLNSQGAMECALAAYLEAGNEARAAQILAGAANTLLDTGQWLTLEGWLGRLSHTALCAQPQLLYAQAEIAAAQGQAESARHTLTVATEMFTSRQDSSGACWSLLAESALAAWQGDRARAQAQALSATIMAEAAGLKWHRSWATWQLGCLAVASGDLDSALLYFNQAITLAEATGDSLAAEGLRRGEALARHWRDMRVQRGDQPRVYVLTGRAERKAAERVRSLLTSPSEHTLLSEYGWSRTPLLVKLPAPDISSQPADSDRAWSAPRWWKTLVSWFKRRQQPPPESYELEPAIEAERPLWMPHVEPAPEADDDRLDAVEVAPPPSPMPPGDPPVLLVEATAPAAEVVPAPESAPVLDVAPALDVATGPELTIDTPPSPTEPALTPDQRLPPPTLTVRMLGTFQLAVNDQPVEQWLKGKAQAVLKYLLIQHDRSALRDILMDVFWPEAESESARNRLNVALHSLRQSFRRVTDAPVIIFDSGTYALNPDLHTWLDVEEFERRVQTGRRLEATGQLKAAVAEYELAENLYRGDFLEEDMYEEWALARREGLRDSHLVVLDHLSRYYLEKGKYSACISLCQKILTKDDCREDAHRRLMRCYARQGERHLALRQYQLCVEALARVMDVSPTQETMALYHQIRKEEAV
jgi:DNA-binding SARP family transcriptional activator